jgi:hypothetical protein
MYKLTKDERCGVYNRVFGTDEGKIALASIMSICGVDLLITFNDDARYIATL